MAAYNRACLTAFNPSTSRLGWWWWTANHAKWIQEDWRL